MYRNYDGERSGFGDTTVNLHLSNFTADGPVQVWRLTSTNAIARLADTTVSGAILAATLPAQSIALFVIPTSSGSPTPPAAPTNLRIVAALEPISGASRWPNTALKPEAHS